MFPFEDDGGVIDLCAEERPFYFNPYSGELSLEFVRTENHWRGGILAYVRFAIMIRIFTYPSLDLLETVRTFHLVTKIHPYLTAWNMVQFTDSKRFFLLSEYFAFD